jgi:hypothetical protein
VRELSGFIGAFWPEPDEELMLLSALGDRATAAEAWSRLAPTFELDAVTWPQYRLVPLLGANLREVGLESADLNRMTGVRRRTWSENQLILHDAAEVLRVLNDAGVATMPLKGLALLDGHYADAGLRPMRDIDLLVDDQEVALRALAAAGWVAKPNQPMRHHGVAVVNATGRSVDVHAYMNASLVLRGRLARSSDDFWEASTPGAIAGVATRLPNPADLLLHVCVHGAQRRSESSLQWVADAAMIVRSSDIDWDRLIRQAEIRRAVITMRETLSYLASRVVPMVPVHVVDALHAMPTTRRDVIVYRATSGIERGGRRLHGSKGLFWHYARISADRTLPRAVIEFPPYLVQTLRRRGRLRADQAAAAGEADITSVPAREDRRAEHDPIPKG